ncbi:MAG: ATP-binding protein, partial [Nanoarchaeota archaeon]
MAISKTKGMVIRGEFGKVIVREKAGADLELGELVVVESHATKILMQVFDLLYASQLSEQNIELISGLHLEEQNTKEETDITNNVTILEPTLRNYKLALLKGIVVIENNKTRACKALPAFLSPVREVTEKDLAFITTPKDPLYFGKLRSGSKILPVDIFLPGKEVFAHHILIAATTGKGKSNLTSIMLWDATKRPYCGVLVLDPHDEYYGRNHEIGLKDHPSKDSVSYYTPKDPPVGAKTLKINIQLVKPQHFTGVVPWSDPQEQALYAYYKEYGNTWIEKIIMNVPLERTGTFTEGTIAVVRRRLLNLLDLEWNGQQLFCQGIFDLNAGLTTIKDIGNELEQAKTVIIDTSHFKGATELLIGSMMSAEILQRYQQYKRQGILHTKPVVSIVIEEAPRVLGKEVLERGGNIFSTIAREGRKFQIGLCAITQLPSLIPREILANMNTKIILGTEMAAERSAIIESAAQDLSEDSRNIASLDKGEAIIT